HPRLRARHGPPGTLARHRVPWRIAPDPDLAPGRRHRRHRIRDLLTWRTSPVPHPGSDAHLSKTADRGQAVAVTVHPPIPRISHQEEKPCAPPPRKPTLVPRPPPCGARLPRRTRPACGFRV